MDTRSPPVESGVAPVIVLVRPQLAENIGATARAMANCALTQLRLVAPRDGWPNPKAVPMAAGATDILEQAKVYESLRDALVDIDRAWATSARSRNLTKRVVTARGAAAAIRTAAAADERCAVVFGPERTGLETDEVVACHELIEIPLDPSFASLNLAQAVLLVAYEWFQTEAVPRVAEVRDPGRQPATLGQIHDFLDHFEAQLDDAGFFRHAQMKPAMMTNLKSFVLRAEPTDQEIRTLHGVITVLSGRRRHQLGE